MSPPRLLRVLVPVLAAVAVGGAGSVIALRVPGSTRTRRITAAPLGAARRPPPASSTTELPTTTTQAPVTTTSTTSTTSTTWTTTSTSAPTPRPTTPVAVPTASPTLPLGGKVIAIDPGHNGANWAHPAEINRMVPAGGFLKACDTTGTASVTGYTESAFNLDVALRLSRDLRERGATVVMTRRDDAGWGPCVNQRAAIGNQVHADAAISIHADGAPMAGRGFDVLQPALVAGYTDAIVAPSHQLALAVRNNFARTTGMPVANYTGVEGLDTRSDLGGLNLSTVPKVFIECGNMGNPSDSSLEADPGWRQRAADALAQALTGYLHGVTG